MCAFCYIFTIQTFDYVCTLGVDGAFYMVRKPAVNKSEDNSNALQVLNTFCNLFKFT